MNYRHMCCSVGCRVGSVLILLSLIVALIYDLANITASTYAITSTNVKISTNICDNSYVKICTEVTVPLSYNVSNITYFGTFNVSVENGQSVNDIVGYYKNTTHILQISYYKNDPNYWDFNEGSIPLEVFRFTIDFVGIIIFILLVLGLIMAPLDSKNNERDKLLTYPQQSKVEYPIEYPIGYC